MSSHRIRYGICAVAGMLLATAARPAVEPHPAWLLDATRPQGNADQMLVTTLQGLVNRDQPRLFLRTFFWVDPTSDDYWMDYLSKEKGYRFQTLTNLNDAIVTFKAQGLVKGLVAYDEQSWAATCVAAMIGGRRGLLPVSASQLHYATPMLDGRNHWVVDDFKDNRWEEWLGQAKLSPAGLLVLRGDRDVDGGVQRIVALEPDRTPFLAITVTSSSHAWGLVANDGSKPEKEGIWLVGPTQQTGEVVVDLRGKLPRPGPRVIVRLIPVGPKGASMTVSRLELRDAEGHVPQALAAQPTTRCFEGLMVVEDLRGKFKDEAFAWSWALTHLLAESNRDMAFSADPGWWNMVGVDLAIAHHAFLYYQKQTDNGGKGIDAPLPIFDPVAKHLKAPAAILGWAEPEWLNAYHVSRAGHFIECSGAPNLSFWQHVATDGPVRFRNPRSKTTPLEEKMYVCLESGDGDAPKTTAGFMNKCSDWKSPARGKVPISWGLAPWLVDIAPAMLEYYAKTATPNDGFFAGPSGLGYCNPTLMPNFPAFAEQTRRVMTQLGLDTIDLWDHTYFRAGALQQEFGVDGVTRAYIKAPLSRGWPVMNTWLDDGTPVFTSCNYDTTQSNALWAITEDPTCLDANDPPGDLARRIEAAAETVEGPFFLLQYGHISPETHAEAAARLPTNRFEFITLADMVHYGRQAGAFTVVAEGSGVEPGGVLNVELARRNPDGENGGAGAMTWTLPAGWLASKPVWSYPEIARGTTIRQTVSITAPATVANGEYRIRFADSNLPWARTLRIRIYPRSQPVSDFSNADGWTSMGHGSLDIRNGIGVFQGEAQRDGMSRAVRVDFDRQPVFELQVSDMSSKWALSLKRGDEEVFLVRDQALLGQLTFPIADKIAWTGEQSVELRFYPCWSLGQPVDVDWMKIHYRK